MKIAIMGAGGIGSYIGALLARAGHDVALVCRGPHLEAIRSHGLQVSQNGSTFTVADVVATNDPAEIGVVDVIIVGVKLYDLARAAVQMKPMVGPRTMVVPTQNGVTAPEIIEAELGPGHVMGGTSFLSAHIVRPGVIHGRTGVNRFVFGEMDGGITGRAQAFQDACNAAGLETVLSTSILKDMWEKFIVIAATSAVCCLARQSVNAVCDDDELRAVMLQGMREAMDVARALGIPISADADQKGLAFNRTAAPNTRVSMLEDLDKGKPLELGWLSGHVARQGSRLGIDVPFHAIAQACLAPYARGARV